MEAVDQLPETLTNPNGIPSAYSPELFESICTEIGQGHSVRRSCEKYGIPAPTFLDWTEISNTAVERYARARSRLADSLINNVVHDIESMRNGEIIDNEPDPRFARVRIDALNLAAGRAIDIAKRLNPAKYGDKIETTTKAEHRFVITLAPGPDVGQVVDAEYKEQPAQLIGIEQGKSELSNDINDTPTNRDKLGNKAGKGKSKAGSGSKGGRTGKGK